MGDTQVQVSIRAYGQSDAAALGTLLDAAGDPSAQIPQAGYLALNTEGAVVGMLGLDESTFPPRVIAIVVYDGWRGYGIGTRLVAEACAYRGSLAATADSPTRPFLEHCGLDTTSGRLDLITQSDRAAFVRMRAFFSEAAEACLECDVCTYWCALLNEAPHERNACTENSSTDAAREASAPTRQDASFNMGTIVSAGRDLLEAIGDDMADAAYRIKEYVRENRDFIKALRSCLLCDRCTFGCPAGLEASKIIATWRELLSRAEVIHEHDSRSVSVDHEWDLFKVYRLLQGTQYDVLRLEDAQKGMTDTLFFPGCSLASYAPALTEKVHAWLQDTCGPLAMTDACCGSPLVSAGLKQRADEFANSLVAQVQRAGIKRIIFVCPGCEKRLRSYFPKDIEFVALPHLMQSQGFTCPTETRLQEPYAVFDSCGDRLLRHGSAVRRMLEGYERRELDACGANAQCCSAGGAVSAFAPALCDERKQQILREAAGKGIGTLVTICPTCASTFAQVLTTVDYELPASGDGADRKAASPAAEALGETGGSDAAPRKLDTLNYLEVLFDEYIDWDDVFARIGAMWTGEYAEWVASVLL